MKKIACIIFLVSITLTACRKQGIKPSGEITLVSRNISSYNALEVQDAIEVNVTQSVNNQELVVEANSNLHEYIVTEVISGKLIIRMKNHVNIKKNPTIKVHLTVSSLSAIEASGASKIELLNPYTNSSVEIKLSGASRIFGNITSNYTKLSASGASSAHLLGQMDNMNVDLSGASVLKDFGLIIDSLDIDMSGASTAYLTVNNSINIKATGASTLFYEGDATIDNIDLSGASQVKKN